LWVIKVLIKAIAQAIPVYVMSVFNLPLGLCDELTKNDPEILVGSRKRATKNSLDFLGHFTPTKELRRHGLLRYEVVQSSSAGSPGLEINPIT
jgi:hypothetical protein